MVDIAEMRDGQPACLGADAAGVDDGSDQGADADPANDQWADLPADTRAPGIRDKGKDDDGDGLGSEDEFSEELRVHRQGRGKDEADPPVASTPTGEVAGEENAEDIPGESEKEKLEGVGAGYLGIGQLERIKQIEKGRYDRDERAKEASGQEIEDNRAESREDRRGETHNSLGGIEAEEARETQPEMQQEIVEGHIGLSNGDDLKEYRQRLLGARHGKRLVEPDAGVADPVEVKSHGYDENCETDQDGLPADRLFETVQEGLGIRNGGSIFCFWSGYVISRFL